MREEDKELESLIVETSDTCFEKGGGPEYQSEVWESQARMVVCGGRWGSVHLCGDGSGKENVLLCVKNLRKYHPP